MLISNTKLDITGSITGTAARQRRALFSSKNESATVSKSKKFLDLNKP